MSDPLAIEPTLGGLLGEIPALWSKPRVGALKSPLLSSLPARGHRALATIIEHEVAPVVSGVR